MIRFTRQIIISATPERIFDYTQDYGNRLRWDTFLKEAVLTGGAEAADKGVRAWCVAHNGLGMETEYVSFRRPHVTAVKMTRGPRMFRSFLGSWRFKALSEKETAVTFLYSFSLRFPFSLFSFFIRKNLEKSVAQRLRDLKGCIEAGA